MFNNIIMGVAVTAFGFFMVRAVRKNHDAIVKLMQDTVERLAHTVGASEETQKRYQELVLQAVAWTDNYVNDPRFWRQVFRTILSMSDPVKRNALLAQFDFGQVKDFLATNLSPEMKEVVNVTKEKIAIETVGAHASIALPPQYVQTRDLKADVVAAVKVVKVSEPEVDVTKQQLEDLLIAHKAMKAEWAAHGTK